MSTETQRSNDLRRRRGRLRAARARALARAAGGRGLLGRLVRPVQAAHARARARRDGARRQGRAREGRRGQNRGLRRRSGSRASRPSRRSGTAASPLSSPARCRRPRWSASSTRSCPRRPTSWPRAGRRRTSARALELDPAHPTARRELGKLLLRRGDTERGRGAARGRRGRLRGRRPAGAACALARRPTTLGDRLRRLGQRRPRHRPRGLQERSGASRTATARTSSAA